MVVIILGSLARALFLMVQTPQKKHELARAFTMRILLSVLVFAVLLMWMLYNSGGV